MGTVCVHCCLDTVLQSQADLWSSELDMTIQQWLQAREAKCIETSGTNIHTTLLVCVLLCCYVHWFQGVELIGQQKYLTTMLFTHG